MKNGHSLSFNILSWVAWAPGIESWDKWAKDEQLIGGESNPNIPFVDAMLRRRLSRFARMALYVAYHCSVNNPAIRSVFASRHGEYHNTLKMLRDLSHNEPLSPTTFSLSVHNAVAGLFSILRHDISPTTALAAGRESFGYGLIEALGQAHSDSPVLLVYVDEPIPKEYQAFEPYPEYPHAIALLLNRDRKDVDERFTLTPTPLPKGEGFVHLAQREAAGFPLPKGEGFNLKLTFSQENVTTFPSPSGRGIKGEGQRLNLPQSLAFLRFLISSTSHEETWQGGRHVWKWQRG